MMLKLVATNAGEATCITTETELTYLVVLDSISKEETERIFDMMEEVCPNLNWIWWETQKVGIIFLVDDTPNKSEIEKIEQKEIYCPYISTLQKDALTEANAGSSRVSVYTEDKNVVCVSTSSTIFRGPLKK